MANRPLYVSAVPGRREVIVSGSDLRDLNVELLEAGEVRGLVSIEGSATLPQFLGIELAPARLPAPAKAPTAAAALAERLASKADRGASSYVRTNGEFSVSDVRAGQYQFQIDGLGTNLYVKAITHNGKDLLRNPIKIEGGKTVGGVQIVLAADVVALSGRALEKKGGNKPLIDAAVLLFPVDAVQRRVNGKPLISRTGKDGRFVIRGAPGEYFVFVFDRQRKAKLARPSEETLTRDPSRLQKTRLQRGDEKRVVEVFGAEY